jgi:hypothetical protein
MNDSNDSFSGKIMEICTITIGLEGVAMEKPPHIHPVKSSPRKSVYLLNDYYSNPSMTEKGFDKEKKSQKQVPFSVEWQMYNA